MLPTAASKTLLVVDDDADARGAIVSLLEMEGYSVAAAGDGQEALDYLHHFPPPAMILLDLMMPSMDGWQFRQQQQSDPILASIPVIIISALGARESNRDGLGTVRTISKPIDDQELLVAIQSCLADAGAVHPARETATHHEAAYAMNHSL